MFVSRAKAHENLIVEENVYKSAGLGKNTCNINAKFCCLTELMKTDMDCIEIDLSISSKFYDE